METLIQKLIEARPALTEIKLDGKNDYQAIVNVLGNANIKALAQSQGTEPNKFVWKVIEVLQELTDADEDILSLIK